MILTPGKIVLFSSYLLIGTYLAFIFPWKRLSVLFQGASIDSNPPNISNYRSLHWLAGVLGIAALTLIPWWYVAISLLISASIHYKNRITKKYIGSSIFIGLIFASFLPWWLHNSKNRLQISISQTLIFLAITTAVYLLFTKAQKLNALSGKLWVCRLIEASFIAALLAVYAMSISVSISTADFAQWHHWGAYIGPAQLIFNGVYPLYDIPMQYGLGPSLAIASGCLWGCWSSLFWVVTICNLIFAFVLAKIALYLYQPRNWLERALVLALVLVLCVFGSAIQYLYRRPMHFHRSIAYDFYLVYSCYIYCLVIAENSLNQVPLSFMLRRSEWFSSSFSGLFLSLGHQKRVYIPPAY